MTSNRYYGDEATLSVDINGTDVTVGEARGVTLTPAADHNEFYGPDSVEWQDVKRSRARVDVEIEIAEFNKEFVQYWLQGGGVGGDTLSTTLVDGNDVALYNITAEQPMTDGSTGSTDSIKHVVNETHFPEMPSIDFSEGEYSAKSLTGRAKTGSFGDGTEV